MMNKSFEITRDQLHAAAVAFAAVDAPKLHWDNMLDEGRAYYEKTALLMFEAAFPGFSFTDEKIEGIVEDGSSARSDSSKDSPSSGNNPVMLEHTTISLFNAHDNSACKGKHCTLHKRSSHHMRRFPQEWNQADARMDRVCAHGVAHPDPDELPSARYAPHACDGCCKIPKKLYQEDDFLSFVLPF